MAQNREIDPADPLDPNLERAVFGREVEDFIENDRIGQYIVTEAKKRIAEVQEQLLTVDPYEPEEIQKLQNRAAVANLVREFLSEAIQNGRDARVLLQQERDEHDA